MCGLCGFLYKDADRVGPVGRTLHAMLGPMARRGTDSTGIALYGPPQPDSYVVRARIDANHGTPERVVAALEAAGTVTERSQQGPNMRARIAYSGDLGDLTDSIEAEPARRGVLDRPRDADRQGRRRTARSSRATTPAFAGSHGVGHTRLATESRVDVEHATRSGRARSRTSASSTTATSRTTTSCAAGSTSRRPSLLHGERLRAARGLPRRTGSSGARAIQEAMRGVDPRPRRHVRLPDLDAGRDRDRPRPDRLKPARDRRVRR